MSILHLLSHSIALVRSYALLFIFLHTFNYNIAAEETPKPEDTPIDVLTINSLEDCLNIALEKNHQRLVSKSAIEIARAQHKQALSAYWPQLKFVSTAIRMVEDPNFIFPAKTISIPGLGGISVPEEDIKLMDRDILISSLDIVYPLFTFGRRAAISKQAEIGIETTKEAARRTDLQIIYDVKRIYYSIILAESIRKLGQDTLDRFEVLLELTERLYKTGSGTVKKTDYLRTKVTVSSIMSMLELLKSNEELAKAALVNFMGLDWKVQVELSEKDIPFKPYKADLTKLVADAYQFNPDWAKIQLGLKAMEAKIRKARSGHFPMIALTGNLNHIENSYDAGIVTDRNKNSWTVGISMNLPLFSGFRTINEIKEARARLNKIKHEKILLSEGLALQVKDALIQIRRSQGQVQATKEALDAALENRELNNRAYQHELVETRDVIEAQLLESFINAQHLKSLHDHAVSRAKVDFIIGYEVERTIQETR